MYDPLSMCWVLEYRQLLCKICYELNISDS